MGREVVSEATWARIRREAHPLQSVYDAQGRWTGLSTCARCSLTVPGFTMTYLPPCFDPNDLQQP